MKAKKIDVKREFGFLIIDGEYYESDMTDGKTTFKQVPKKKVEDKIKMVNQIVKNLKGGLDREAVLRETLLTNFDEVSLVQLHGLLNHPTKKYKPKTREHHCVDMKVGNMIIPIIN